MVKVTNILNKHIKLYIYILNNIKKIILKKHMYLLDIKFEKNS